MREIAGIVGGFGLGLASFAVGGGLIRAEPSGGERAAESGAAVAVALAPSAAAGQAPASLDDRWDDDSSLPAHAERVASYTLVARLDPKAHEVEATGTIRWTNTSRVPQQELWLHLYLNAFKNERTLYMRTPGSGFRGGGTLADWGSISVVRLRARELEADLWPPADAPIDPVTTPGKAQGTPTTGKSSGNAADRAAAERASADRSAAQKALAERKAADREAAERANADRATAEKALADRGRGGALERAAAERAAAEKAAGKTDAELFGTIKKDIKAKGAVVLHF